MFDEARTKLAEKLADLNKQKQSAESKISENQKIIAIAKEYIQTAIENDDDDLYVNANTSLRDAEAVIEMQRERLKKLNTPMHLSDEEYKKYIDSVYIEAKHEYYNVVREMLPHMETLDKLCERARQIMIAGDNIIEQTWLNFHFDAKARPVNLLNTHIIINQTQNMLKAKYNALKKNAENEW